VSSRDPWQLDAAHRLRKHLMRSVLLGKNFAPDQTLELSKAGKVGPVSAQISQIFQRHADLWAEDMRTSAAAEVDFDADAAFVRTMAEAELEVGRFIAGHKLTTGAAA
jgi:hypothetical protein